MANLRVVVVDDEPVIRMDLKVMLKNAGYEVVGEGSDGFEAIELCRKLKPDVVLLDIRMPNLDGMSAASVISAECPHTAIVMLTAYRLSEYIDKAKECRISSYLVKPVNEDLIVPNIELAVVRNNELLQYREEVKEATAQLEKRKTIERAKGALMKHRGLSEAQAYNLIRQISKDKNISMYKVSEFLLKQYEV